MADPKRRTVHTNWNRYNCCNDHKPYEYRVTVELVGVNGSNPNDVDLRNIAELLGGSADAMGVYCDSQDDSAHDSDDDE